MIRAHEPQSNTISCKRQLQVLDLLGAPLQLLGFKVPLSGVCSDARHVVVTAVEPELGGLDMQAPKKLPHAVHVLEVCQPKMTFEDAKHDA